MWRFILISFGFLGFAFYELSGGSEFDAEETRLSRIEAPAEVEETPLDRVEVAAAVPTLPENVTRVSLNLDSVNDVLAPNRTVNTTPARITQDPQQDDVSETAVSEEEPTIVLPSLIVDSAVVTPVTFGGSDDGAASETDIRSVSANSVNVRGGPGTNFSIVNRMTRGAEVVVLQDPGNGWVQLRPIGGGTVGWMADYLLTKG